MREDSSLVIESIPLTDITSVHAHDEEARNIGEDTSCLHCIALALVLALRKSDDTCQNGRKT